MRVADGVDALELTMNIMGNQSTIYPILIHDNDTVILVDTGIPGQLQQIREAMERVGVPFAALDKVILTHQDIDHIGSLSDILNASRHKIEVLAHEADKPYIEGDKPLLKMNRERMTRMFEALPEAQRKQAEAMFSDPPKAHVDRTVSDGETLPYCGGITVIHTPGHAPGHISLYLNQSKTLIAGDAMSIVDGRLSGPNPQATPDMDTALHSLKEFPRYDIETVVCYHGGLFRDNANRRLEELSTA